MKRLWKIFRNLALSLLVLVVLLWILIQLPPVQTWIIGQVTSKISEETGYEMEIGHVDVRYPVEFVFDDVICFDLAGDTLLSADEIAVGALGSKYLEGEIEAHSVQLESAHFHLTILKGDSLTNLDPLLDYFASAESSDSSTTPVIKVSDFQLERTHFSFHDYNFEPIDSIVDFNHLDIRDISTDITTFKFDSSGIDADINKLTFIEQSGFDLDLLQGHFKMREDTLRIDQMTLNTPRSSIVGSYELVAEEWSYYGDFNNRVTMRGEFDRSTVHFADIAYFTTELAGLDRSVEFEGLVRGRVSNLKGRNLFVGIDDNTWFKGNVDLAGLPEIDQTFIDLTVKEVQSVKSELDQIPLPPFSSNKTLQTPNNFQQLGTISFTGKFTGFLTDFVAFGELNTALGQVNSDIEFYESEKTFAYKGSLSTKKFDLKKFYNSPDLGKLTSDFFVEGSGLTREDLDVSIDGKIGKIDVLGYSYKNVVTTGSFRQGFFNGELFLNDENAQLSFDGLIDFGGPVPKMDFYTSITHLNPVKLNLIQLSDYTSLSGDFRIKGQGRNINSVNGSISGENILFCTLRNEYPIADLDLNVSQGKFGKKFVLESDVASGKLEGKFDFQGLTSGAQKIIADIIPQIKTDQSITRGKEDFSLTLNIHNFELVSEVFIPELNLASGTRFSLLMNDENEEFEATFSSDYVQYLDYSADTITLDISHPDESIYLSILTDGFRYGPNTFKDLSIDVRNELDTIYSNLNWGTKEDIIRGEIMGMSVIQSNNSFYNRLDAATLWFDQTAWTLKDTTTINVLNKRIDIENFNLANEESFVRVDGTIDTIESEELEIALQNIQLSAFNLLTSPVGVEQSGIVSGALTLRDAYDKTFISSDLQVLDYTINSYLIGNILTETSWRPSERRLLVAGELERNDLRKINFGGFYYPDREESPIDIACTLESQSLDFLNGFIDEGISDIKGNISGVLDIEGRVDNPKIDGVLDFEDASVHVDYLNTRFYFENEAQVFPNEFWLDFPVTDENGNQAYMAGTIQHQNFTNWNFDIFLDMSQEPFLVLNTTEKDNSLYFGRALTTGFVSIYGEQDNLEIDINARSEGGTTLALPLGGSEEVTFEDFITFVDPDADEVEEEGLDLSGISMNFELDITPEAKFRIIFDELVGDEISGRGQGHINMVINNLSTFNMYGDIEVVQGKYLFTLKNLINKEFLVEPGGRISWFGDPLAADIDLQAVYKLHTSLYDLVPDETDQYRQRVPVDLTMNLSGKLLSPGINFDIELPSSDEITQARVESAISTEQEMNRQAFALLVLRRFISPPEVAKTNTSLGIAENSTELLTSQLSNWLSQISDDFDIGVNYSPGDEISNEELAVALSTQLFNDRLLVSGNFGVATAQNSAAGENPNSLIGDLRIEYKVTQDGKIRVIVYNQSNQFDIANTQQSNYTQGLGVVYQQEFDSLGELFRLEQ
ncbi:translocation/assembly module TamB domain-containing protein [Sanyastnella coralliicola]|uniref:translocation/assembly module TamB domain-containing protein n=1 Tax=Sanyastnella coralliicola TaxID=3069118 RepID=UPI0027B90C7C|nr:translocation/assembly module TamB domain-containing protein [Longitalea sp. SCSIO 12813]